VTAPGRTHLRLVPLDGAPPPRLKAGDLVVYGSHGIGRVEPRLSGSRAPQETISLAFESGLKVTLPLARARDALRSLSGERELEDVRDTLAADVRPAIEPWAKRHRSMHEKVAAGRVTGLAEIVREGLQSERLASATTGRGAPPSERQLYRRARALLAAEIATSRGIDVAEAETWIDDQVGSVHLQT
jgi:RNA polymerase-interacting CarD/CdnL/TRCF family regulator